MIKKRARTPIFGKFLEVRMPRSEDDPFMLILYDGMDEMCVLVSGDEVMKAIEDAEKLGYKIPLGRDIILGAIKRRVRKV